VLYRNSKRLANLTLANDAFEWLFNEGPGHPDWEEKKRNGHLAFSFVMICEVLDLDVEEIRKRLRTLTARDIQTLGRPPTRRKMPPQHGDYSEVIKLELGSHQSDVSALLASGDLLDLDGAIAPS